MIVRYPRPCVGMAVAALAALWLSACVAQISEPTSTLGTPEHHVSSGFRLMDREYLDDAKREFEFALGHAPDYSSAHRGLGVVYAMEGDFQSGEQALNRARDAAENDRDRALALVALMQLHSWQREKGWLQTVENLFRQAIALEQPLPEAYYHMGLAYREADQMDEAIQAFEQVVEFNQVFVPQANQALAEIRETQGQ